MDLQYIQQITLKGDIQIICDTVHTVLKREGISHEGHATMENFAEYVMTRASKQ